MENNTLISQELEEMRSQIGILKEKLEKQNIINGQHIRKSMKSNMSEINKTILGAIIGGAFALPYCTWFFCSQGLSPAFVISTAVMLAACLILTIMQRVKLNRLDFSQGNLMEVAKRIYEVKKHYQDWKWIAFPLITIWIAWLMYEMINRFGLEEPTTIGFCIGAIVGVIIGGFIGMKMNRKVIDKAGEILEQIEELQKES